MIIISKKIDSYFQKEVLALKLKKTPGNEEVPKGKRLLYNARTLMKKKTLARL